MKILDKYGIFKECGFKDHHMLLMPAIHFEGYDKVMDYCYAVGKTEGYSEGSLFGAASEELYKKIKDLETTNARLFERNHELQVDNEESLKEVENQYKIVADLRNQNMNALSSIKDVSGYVEELQQENLEYSKRCDELRKYNTELVRDALKQDIESVPKSKFVITVEEF